MALIAGACRAHWSSSTIGRTVATSPDRIAFLPRVSEMVPGITIVAIVTAAAFGIRQLPGFNLVSPMFSAIFIGIIFANFTSVPERAVPGIVVTGKKMLRLAVALLGLQLTLWQVVEVGLGGMAALTLVVVSTYLFTVGIANILGIDPKLGRLLAAGTSICGASAIAAANSIEQAKDEDVSYAIACITLFGTLSIVVYPLVAALVGLSEPAFGFWAGASIHEVAQVVATGFQLGNEAGEFAVIVKLSRVLLLAPLLVVVALLSNLKRTQNGIPLSAGQIVPKFVCGFILLMMANTAGLIPEDVRQAFVQVTPVILTASLGALGLGTRFDALQAQGLRPLLVAALAALFVSLAALLMLPLLA